METFLSIHQNAIVGTLSTFDHMIFKGHLTGFFPEGAFSRFLSQQRVWLKDFSAYVQQATHALRAHAHQLD